ncbi:hypothetical protein B0J13DRAFT_621885 [Dactylonectria estremocensis]|uniref:Uncharacterized protein n=1 Tax=Dactylonectria estremocensis TaxID=1079267 RepID=A0A9P9EYK9_9HYPO|nr:hypothetical protein B0J13DRAFT_621885 [Dactylonectria estremocensis]
MIEEDFNELLAIGKVLQARVPFEYVVHQIRNIRQPDAEDSYWKYHLSHAQDTRFTSYINILYSTDDAAGVENDDAESEATIKVFSRHRLVEPLASNYFTVTEPSLSTASNIEGLETSHLCPYRFFLNLIIQQGQNISAVNWKIF